MAALTRILLVVPGLTMTARTAWDYHEFLIRQEERERAWKLRTTPLRTLEDKAEVSVPIIERKVIEVEAGLAIFVLALGVVLACRKRRERGEPSCPIAPPQG